MYFRPLHQEISRLKFHTDINYNDENLKYKI
jgi:hypothetical protein